MVDAHAQKRSNKPLSYTIVSDTTDMEAFNFHVGTSINSKVAENKITIFKFTDDASGITHSIKSTRALMRRMNDDCSRVDASGKIKVRLFMQRGVRADGSNAIYATIFDYQMVHVTTEVLLQDLIWDTKILSSVVKRDQ